jgi:hypothetical protein
MSESTGATSETHDFATVITDIDAESKHVIRKNARLLSPTDDAVEDHTGELATLTDTSLSSMLFDATVDDVRGIPDDTVTVVFSKGVEFPEGDGYMTFKVTADTETRDVKSMTVNARLY